MSSKIAMIGFGEAARAFAGDASWSGATRAFDIKIADGAWRGGINAADFPEVTQAISLDDALQGADAVYSLVTANESVAVSAAASRHLAEGSLFIDMNSVSPDAKRMAAELVHAHGGRYVDAAIMSPVHPSRLQVPVLLSGPHAAAALSAMKQSGFGKVRVAGNAIGDAAMIKMIRSVFVKGTEALMAECLIAADAAGVTSEVLASLGEEWAVRADYNLERMLTHGIRRAAEMKEVCATLASLGVDATLTTGALQLQRELGLIGGAKTPVSLSEKLTLIRTRKNRNVA